ncbi:MAG: hypothetical protein AAGC55_10115 [Myxococcota bacterium]
MAVALILSFFILLNTVMMFLAGGSSLTFGGVLMFAVVLAIGTGALYGASNMLESDAGAE